MNWDLFHISPDDFLCDDHCLLPVDEVNFGLKLLASSFGLWASSLTISILKRWGFCLGRRERMEERKDRIRRLDGWGRTAEGGETNIHAIAELLDNAVDEVYTDGRPKISRRGRKATINDFYDVILPSLRRLHCDLVKLDYQDHSGSAGVSSRIERSDQKKPENQVGFSNLDLEREDECGICLEPCTKIVLPNCCHPMCINGYRDRLTGKENGEYEICRRACERICEVTEKETCVSLNETLPFPKNGTINLIQKCKFCKREGTVTMILGRGSPLTFEFSEGGKHDPLMIEGTKFEDIDLSRGDFSEYDEKGECPVMISNVTAMFKVVDSGNLTCLIRIKACLAENIL
ncbi:hypothetical protein L2E82_10017 [Cichorium intybus]|uniref:Uncharacterized protein n=1 Tax=Cichorium intybus TaxID=13427 RepID=A0ACB9G9J2_CICIN|nr:hypothetical protein L2E82_10017 [Cichorium intybus]